MSGIAWMVAGFLAIMGGMPVPVMAKGFRQHPLLDEACARQAMSVLAQVQGRELSSEEGADLLFALGAGQICDWPLGSKAWVAKYVGRPDTLPVQLEDGSRLDALMQALREKAGRPLAEKAPEGREGIAWAASKGMLHEDPVLRMAAIRMLSGVPGGKAAGALADAAEDECVLVRFWAVRLLAGRSESRLFNALVAALDDPAEVVALRAVRSLKGVDEPRVRRALEQLAQDGPSKVRRAARAALTGPKVVKQTEEQGGKLP